jgi:DNA end-binding protein Ku
MRSIWNGVIAFGLVSIPIRLHAATSSHDIALHQYHRADGGRIRYQKTCEIDGAVVQPEEIVRGIETEEDEIVLLDDDDLEDLPVRSSKTIEVLGFVPVEQIDPIFYEKAYYAEPGKAAGKPYVLLREALAGVDRIAIVKVTLRRRESLAALRPLDDLLMVQTMLWPDEIRKPEVSGVSGEARKAELQMADALIDTMAMDFHPEEYTDAYHEALQATIEAKMDGRTTPKPKREEPMAEVVNLMDALERSVAAKRPSGKRGPAKKAAKKTSRQTAKKTAKKATKKATKKPTTAKKTAKAASRKRKSA